LRRTVHASELLLLLLLLLLLGTTWSTVTPHRTLSEKWSCFLV
jgi:hypothetical protein